MKRYREKRRSVKVKAEEMRTREEGSTRVAKTHRRQNRSSSFESEVVDWLLDVEADGMLRLEGGILEDGGVVEDNEDLPEERSEDEVFSGDVDAREGQRQRIGWATSDCGGRGRRREEVSDEEKEGVEGRDASCDR